MSSDRQEIEEFLLEPGTGRLPHPGGTLFDHLPASPHCSPSGGPTTTCRITSVYIRDPDGNLIEIASYPGASPAEQVG